jgi:hypothetical protein
LILTYELHLTLAAWKARSAWRRINSYPQSFVILRHLVTPVNTLLSHVFSDNMSSTAKETKVETSSISEASQKPIDESSQKPIIIALMGQTGTGKSSFIMVATGSKSVEIGHSLKSCTRFFFSFRPGHKKCISIY